MTRKSIAVIRIATAALCAIAALALTAPTHGQCVGDIDGSGNTDGDDLATLLVAWGTSGQGQNAVDLNGNGTVGPDDLLILLSGWGPCEIVPAWATLIEARPDPAVVTDPSLRAAITATGYAWRVRDTATQIEMMLIPPGTFQMGCSAMEVWCWPWERPLHTVTLTNAFYIGRYEVTQAQWQARMLTNPSVFTIASLEVPTLQVPNRPVENMDWQMIQNFLSQTGMRLPTEAEWEYAYRAGTTTAFHGYSGNMSGTNNEDLIGIIGWNYQSSCSDGAACQTRPVGGKLANGFGLHDMAGNVGEWVSDWFGFYSSVPQVNPTGPASGSFRMARGGSWNDSFENCRANFRGDLSSPASPGSEIGFRVVRAP